jgi:hypothetical protein
MRPSATIKSPHSTKETGNGQASQPQGHGQQAEVKLETSLRQQGVQHTTPLSEGSARAGKLTPAMIAEMSTSRATMQV